MVKKRALVERLNIALGASSSEKDVEEVYCRLFKIGRFALGVDFDEFYKEVLKYDSLIPDGTVRCPRESVQYGEKLALLLKGEVILPDRNSQKRGIGRRYRIARKKEFELLRSFYNSVEDGRE